MQQVQRVVSILEVLADSTNGIGISELSIRIDLPKSTIHRILKSLMECNMATQDLETKKYYLGLQVLILGNRALEGIGIREIARPYLSKLRDEIGETVFLSILNNNKVICVEKFDTVKKLRYFVQVGNTMPFHCAASAKAIMAYQDVKTINEALSKFKLLKYTDYTMSSMEKLLLQYEEIRAKGYAVCNQEMENLVIGIAAPIFDHHNKVNSSICVLGLKSSLNGDKLNDVINKMLGTASEITEICNMVKRDRKGNIA